jgi:trehalose synthase
VPHPRLDTARHPPHWDRQAGIATAQTRLQEVQVQAVDIARLAPLIGVERMETVEHVAEVAHAALAGRAVININSAAAGGGVAEMLMSLLSYVRGAGIDARWLVISGDHAFFETTKRIHHGLYGGPGDGGPLGELERRHYEQVLHENANELLAVVRRGDVILLHDPQPAGLARVLAAAGARVIWRCHVGCDVPNEWTRRAWEFLRPYLDGVSEYVVSRPAFAPPWADPAGVTVIPPSIDPFSPKNQPMSHRTVHMTLGYVGLVGDGSHRPDVPFARGDGSPGRINRHADILQTGPPPPPEAPLVVQVSRWDHQKDMEGVIAGFAEHVDPRLGAHLVLAGPIVTGVADDPEARVVLEQCIVRWRQLPHSERSRVHLACLPMADPDEQAAIVNALQRHARVVVQKSLAEGFGLTVTEAMWKARPIVASAVGGIVDQIIDGEHGLLLGDPADLAGFGRAIASLLTDPQEAERLGRNAQLRATEEYLGDRHLVQYGLLFAGAH